MRLFTTFNTLFILITGASTLFSQTKVNYPETKKESVKDDYFGTIITDPYRWLEDDRSKATEEWVKKQNVVTETYLKNIPQRDGLKKRLTELWDYNKQSAPFKKGDYFFCYKNTGLQNQSVLFMGKSYESDDRNWHELLDPNTLSTDGTVALNSIALSKDCKTLAYSVSEAGSDWQEIRFRDVATKKDLPDVIKWVKFSGMSWKANGIYYSRYDEPKGSVLTQKNTGHKLYYHKLGTTQDKDELIYKDDKNPSHNFGAQVTKDENYLIIYSSKSTSGDIPMMMDLRDKKKTLVPLTDNFDYDYSIIANKDSLFYVLTNKKAPRYKLESFVFQNGKITNEKVIIPEKDELLEGVRLCNNKIIADYLYHAASKLFMYELNGTLISEIKLPGICKLRGMNTDSEYDFATYSVSQYIAPDQVYYLNANTLESKLIFKPNCAFNAEEYVTTQVFYKSKDGTSIPMFMTHKKDLSFNGNTPCFVYGYGGFNISLGPEFRIDRALFLEAGGVYCVPNLRGGGEYGKDWHVAGTKCRKQNVFDDFIAACEFLVAKRVTNKDKIAIHGRSNGGLLIGAVMTQRPDICKVALPTVGVLDMLRFHLFTIGRAWITDYGSSDNAEEFKCLVKYSPLHNIKESSYPATMVLTGDHDDRVVPAHSFKFAATLQNKNNGAEPMLIRIDVDAGHGAGKPTAKQITEFADMWAFTFYHLGIKLDK